MNNEKTTINNFNVLFQCFYVLLCVYTHFIFNLNWITLYIWFANFLFLLKNVSWSPSQKCN